ncbi:hypothetical protein HGB07_04835 [Candidatus Roizmanbacteria bacterium]|nr:hypothetical protein [Candidatus Roizmanbacteria bacterium]
MEDNKNSIDHKKNIEELLSSACDFQAESERARAKAREIYRKKEPEKYNVFRMTLDGIIVRTSRQLLNKFDNTTDKISYQISLSASFVRTHFIVNEMILNGDLIEAFTLIRKQLEALTRLHEIDKKPLLKLLKKTPNVINLFGESGKKLYPNLSEIAHFATPNVGELLTINTFDDGRVGPSLHPTYNIDALACYDRHAYVSIYFVFWFMDFLKKIYRGAYNREIDEKTFYIMIGVAEECGIIQLPAIKNETT